MFICVQISCNTTSDDMYLVIKQVMRLAMAAENPHLLLPWVTEGTDGN